jgi:hypothetical protein
MPSTVLISRPWHSMEQQGRVDVLFANAGGGERRTPGSKSGDDQNDLTP